MRTVGISVNPYLLNTYVGVYPQTQISDLENQAFESTEGEYYVTWKYDEEGNIVYYKYNKITGKLISSAKYKNPANDISLNKKPNT